jgi:hypothetical protein
MLASRGALLVDEQAPYANTELSRKLKTVAGWRDEVLGIRWSPNSGSRPPLSVPGTAWPWVLLPGADVRPRLGEPGACFLVRREPTLQLPALLSPGAATSTTTR